MNAEFSFAKLQTLPFFGTGIVEIPAGGYKRSKNSRRMQMVFFVHTGKVDVMVNDTEFTITKGGCWHVPRGM
jgi:centromere protein C